MFIVRRESTDILGKVPISCDGQYKTVQPDYATGRPLLSLLNISIRLQAAQGTHRNMVVQVCLCGVRL